MSEFVCPLAHGAADRSLGISISKRIRIGRDDDARDAEAVDRRTDDSAGIAGPLATGIEPGDTGTLPGLRIAEDADRRAAARLGAGESRVPEEMAAKSSVHHRQAAF